jgi:hypothetical protein
MVCSLWLRSAVTCRPSGRSTSRRPPSWAGTAARCSRGRLAGQEPHRKKWGIAPSLGGRRRRGQRAVPDRGLPPPAGGLRAGPAIRVTAVLFEKNVSRVSPPGRTRSPRQSARSTLYHVCPASRVAARVVAASGNDGLVTGRVGRGQEADSDEGARPRAGHAAAEPAPRSRPAGGGPPTASTPGPAPVRPNAPAVTGGYFPGS